MPGDLTPPERDSLDHLRAAALVGASAVPVLGGPVAELVDVLLPSSLERRRQDWYATVAEALTRLEQRHGVTVADLADDEGFMTLVIETSKAALGTHLEEKIRLLASCLYSRALHEYHDDFIAMRFVQFVEELSPEHFLVLRYLVDPARWYDEHGITPLKFPDAPGIGMLRLAKTGVPDDVLTIVLRDLADRRLAVDNKTMYERVETEYLLRPLATDLGRDLLRFVVAMDEPDS